MQMLFGIDKCDLHSKKIAAIITDAATF